MSINFQTILNSWVDPKVLATLGTVLSLILADFVFGVLVSLRNGNFSLSKLPQFVQTSLLPYIGGLLMLALFSNTNTELKVLFFSIAATVTVKFLADIKDKVIQLFAGIQIQFQSPIGVKEAQSQPLFPTKNAQTDVQTPPAQGQPAELQSK